jgi:DNA repair exonuclease SbcCD ATPase subunit
MNRWRLNSLEINGFRGVAGKQSFDFLGRNGLLFGPNGQGKSTVALALQWVLFGKFPPGILQNTQLSSFLRSHRNDAGPYSVRIVLKRNDQAMAVYREEGTKRKRFELELGGGQYDDVKAEVQRDAPYSAASGPGSWVAHG